MECYHLCHEWQAFLSLSSFWIRSSWTYSLTVLAPSTSIYTLVAPWAVSIYYSIKFTRVNLSDICLNECCFWPNVGVFSPSLVSDVSPYGHRPASIPTTWSNVSLPITMAWQEEIILMNHPLSWLASVARYPLQLSGRNTNPILCTISLVLNK